jgi:DNA-binding transcriptional LysR family regulator
MGTMLFNRTSRRIALTDTGASLAERAAKLLSDAIETEECAREEVGAPRGTVRLAVPMSFGLAEIGPIVADFLTLNPGISVELNLSDALVDLVGEGYDVALRIAVLPDSSLRVRRLRDVRRLIVASPSWIARHGEPLSPSDIAPDQLFGYTNQPRRSAIVLKHLDGREEGLVPAGRLHANNGDVVIAAVEAGLGISLAPDFIVQSAIDAGRLIAILPDWTTSPIALNLVTPPGRLRPRRVTALIDHLLKALENKANLDVVNDRVLTVN